MNELHYVDYSGESIEFEEFENACVVRDLDRNTIVAVRTLEDAVYLRNALNRLIRKMTVEGSL